MPQFNWISSQPRIAFATGNAHKLIELQRQIGIPLLSPEDMGLKMNVEETGSTFEENALLKSSWLCAASSLPSLADDSGLCVRALDGRPGLYSARYGGENRTDAGRRELLLQEMKDVPDGERQATFICVLALSIPGRAPVFFRGESHGTILRADTGSGGFGYDPVFLDSSGKSYAQLSSEEKDAISHRGKAIRALREWPGF